MSTQQTNSAGRHHNLRLAPVLGLIGTFILCGAVLMAHLSPGQLKPVAIVLWLCGFGIQIAAFCKACAERSEGRR